MAFFGGMLAQALYFCVLGALGYITGKFLNWIGFLSHEYDTPIPVHLEDPDSTTPVTLPSIFDAPSKALSIIVPAYNEEDRLPSTLDEALAYLQKRRDRQGPQFTYEVIVVDDGSKDGTVRVALDYVRRHGMDTVRVLRVPSNRGKGHAVKRGMLAARGEFCLFMDADGATRFADLEKLEAGLEKAMLPTFGKSAVASTPGALAADGQGPLGTAFGSRSHLEKEVMVKRSKLRNVLTWGFHFLVMLVAGGRVRDTQCGFKLFTRRAAAVLYSNQRLQRWCFDVELLYLAEQMHIPVVEVNVNWTEIPGSKIRFTSILSMALEMVIIKICYQIIGTWKIHSEVTVNNKKAVTNKKEQ